MFCGEFKNLLSGNELIQAFWSSSVKSPANNQFLHLSQIELDYVSNWPSLFQSIAAITEDNFTPQGAVPVEIDAGSFRRRNTVCPFSSSIKL